MEGRTERLSSLEKDLQPPGRGQDLNIIVRTERSIRGPDDELVRVPDKTPFPDGFEVTYSSTEPDGSLYRVWHKKRDVPKTMSGEPPESADGKGSESDESGDSKL
jgi:hypothetical protein